MGLVAILRIKARQRARLTRTRTADANSKLFYLYANGRRRKNHIHLLKTRTGLAVTHEEKETEIDKHFSAVLGTLSRSARSLNWSVLGLQSLNLSNLDSDLEEDEIKQAVMDLPKQKAPDPDVFLPIARISSKVSW